MSEHEPVDLSWSCPACEDLRWAQISGRNERVGLHSWCPTHIKMLRATADEALRARLAEAEPGAAMTQAAREVIQAWENEWDDARSMEALRAALAHVEQPGQEYLRGWREAIEAAVAWLKTDEEVRDALRALDPPGAAEEAPRCPECRGRGVVTVGERPGADAGVDVACAACGGSGLAPEGRQG